MDSNPLHGKPLALEPMDDHASAAEGNAAPDDKSSIKAGAKHDLHLTTTDEFLAAASKEYEAGEIDAALWRRAGEQSRGDASLVIAAYLRARATALKLKQMEHQRSQGRPRSESARSPRKLDSERAPKEPTTSADIRSRGLQPVIKYAAAGVAGLGLVVAVVWWIASPRQSEIVRPAAASAALPAPSRPAPVVGAPPAPVVGVPPAAGGANQSGPDPAEVEAKVQELKKTGNWNMLVIYATEWTRRQPASGAAWHELSVGYLNLRQFGDALDAAKKAVQAAPDNPLLWTDLGRINLTVQRSADAGIAFDRALALSPDDTEALCGAASVAQQQGRRSDADAFSKRVKTEGACRDTSDGTSVASVAPGSAIRRPVPSAGR